MMKFGIFKSLFGMAGEKEKLSRDSQLIFKYIHELLHEIFDEVLVGHIRPASFDNGVVTIACSHEYMLELNDRSDFFVKKIKAEKSLPLVKKVRFVIE
jgi:hypothetical protein